MVRWRCCLFLAMLLILPVKAGSKLDDEDDETDIQEPKKNAKKGWNGLKLFRKITPPRPVDDGEEEDEDDEDEEELPAEKVDHFASGRRTPALVTTTVTTEITRTVPRRPLECYVCAYKAETQLQSCLDPTKFRVHTMLCHSPDDKCFTSVISKGNNYEAVIRGCRSACTGTPETTCCELNRCNNQALATPVAGPRALTEVVSSPTSKSSKSIPPSIVFFVTILLVLQTVVKVAFV